jgi:hypothetical protein
MADSQTPVFHLIKPEIGGSIDTWGVKLNANADVLELALVNGIKSDGTTDFSALQTFDDVGFKLGSITISFNSGDDNIEFTDDVNGLIATLNIDGTFTARDVAANPALA